MKSVQTLCVALSVLLVGLKSPSLAKEKSKEDLGNPDRVVQAEPRPAEKQKYKKRVEFYVPDAVMHSAFKVRYRNAGGASGDMRFGEAGITGTLEETVGDLKLKSDDRIANESGQWATKVELLIFRAASAKLTLQIENRLYDLSVDPSVLGECRARAAPPPIPWNTFYAYTKEKSLSDATQRKVLQASVRVNGPSGSASGTLVEAPENYQALLDEGEHLVYTAGHVVPFVPGNKPLDIDVFEWKDKRPVSFTRFPARLVATGYTVEAEDERKEMDVAVLAVRTGETVVTKVKVADSLRWYTRDTSYFQVGCPGGKDPKYQECRVINADRVSDVGTVTTDQPSVGGWSGGGLFDPEGALVAMLSGSNGPNGPIDSDSLGTGLIGERADRERRANQRASGHFSYFAHPYAATLITRAAAVESLEEKRWKTLRLPIASRFGTSARRKQGLEDLRRDVDLAVANLQNEADVRQKFNEALAAYEAALEAATHQAP